MQNTNETPEEGGGIVAFIQKNRKAIYICSGIILLSLIGCFSVFSLRDVFRKKAVDEIEELNKRYEALLPVINEEYSAYDAENLLIDLEIFAKKKSGYAGSKAWSLAGSILSERKEWAGAEAAWIAAAEKGAKIFLAPIAWFNAGIAAEEQGKPVEAIDHFTKSITLPAGFSSAPRAQFSIGRLWESLDNTDEALTAYRAVISNWPYDTTWVNLAYSRIIALEVR